MSELLGYLCLICVCVVCLCLRYEDICVCVCICVCVVCLCLRYEDICVCVCICVCVVCLRYEDVRRLCGSQASCQSLCQVSPHIIVGEVPALNRDKALVLVFP